MAPAVPLREVLLEGWGLHSGAPVRVLLAAGEREAPVLLRAQGRCCRIDELVVVSTRRATTVEHLAPEGVLRVGTVEHLTAALGGLGIRRGLAIEVDGLELPLLDGGAAQWVAAIDCLGLAPDPPALRVVRAGAIDVGSSRYELEPGDRPVVRAILDLDDPRLAPAAEWRGDPADFRARVAPSRTFAWVRDADELLASGLARRVDPASVILIAPEAIHCAGRPFEPDEPARHKLLDLMGDLYLSGGPPLGTVLARRPGHAATHEAVQIALASGLLAPR